jgi:hypothetical protein
MSPKITNWTLPTELKGCEYKVVDWKIDIDALIKEGRVIESSHEEELNSSMKIEDVKMSK